MFKNHIREAVNFNKTIIHEQNGIKIYYDKYASYFSLIVKILFLGLFIYEVPIARKSILQLSIFMFGSLALSYHITSSLGRIIIKRPIFILNNNQIYYLKTDTWYNVLDFEFIDKFIGKYNFLQTFCMVDKVGNELIREKNWHLKKEDYLKHLIDLVKFREDLSKRKYRRRIRK